ncbi:hypothetical protein Tco_0240845 [Tanacetum coccineum]
MDAINLLILDEGHHAVKNHPYSLVMSEFCHTTKEKRPLVFGMTASPINLKVSPAKWTVPSRSVVISVEVQPVVHLFLDRGWSYVRRGLWFKFVSVIGCNRGCHLGSSLASFIAKVCSLGRGGGHDLGSHVGRGLCFMYVSCGSKSCNECSKKKHADETKIEDQRKNE